MHKTSNLKTLLLFALCLFASSCGSSAENSDGISFSIILPNLADSKNSSQNTANLKAASLRSGSSSISAVPIAVSFNLYENGQSMGLSDFNSSLNKICDLGFDGSTSSIALTSSKYQVHSGSTVSIQGFYVLLKVDSSNSYWFKQKKDKNSLSYDDVNNLVFYSLETSVKFNGSDIELTPVKKSPSEIANILQYDAYDLGNNTRPKKLKNLLNGSYLSNPCTGENFQLYTSLESTLLTGNIDGPGVYNGYIPGDSRFNNPLGITTDSDNNFYIADSANHAIRKISSDGRTITLAGKAGRANSGSQDGIGESARFNSPTGIAVDGSKNVYVTDNANNTIRKISPEGVVTTIAGNSSSNGTTDGPGALARFNSPKGLFVNESGTVIYVADGGNQKIRKMTYEASTNAWTVGSLILDTGLSGPWGVIAYSNYLIVLEGDNARVTLFDISGFNGTKIGGTSSIFQSPRAMAIYNDKLYIADTFNNRIKKYSFSANPFSITLDSSVGNGSRGSTDGSGVDVTFDLPSGITVDSAGNVFVSDSGNHAIRKIDSSLNVTTFAGSAPSDSGFDDSISLANAKFKNLFGIDADSLGNLYVAEQSYHVIRKISPSQGTVDRYAGQFQASGNTTGDPLTATIDSPNGIAVDKNSGALYVTGTGLASFLIRKIVPGSISDLAGAYSSPGYSDGGLIAARFSGLSGMAIDDFGSIYVADSFNSVIRKIIPSGPSVGVSTFAGVANTFARTDGITTAASFNRPIGVALSKDNNIVYVADTGNHSIRKIQNGTVSTLAGNGTAGFANGVGSAALFNSLQGLAVDGSGNLYVADTGNNIIRKVTPEGVVTTLYSLSQNLNVLYEPQFLTIYGNFLYVTMNAGVLKIDLTKVEFSSD